MTRRANHRGWMVVESIASADGTRCVDLFEDPHGGYGFEHLRTDPEDRGRWTPIGGFAAARYPTAGAAASAATAAVPWLEIDHITTSTTGETT